MKPWPPSNGIYSVLSTAAELTHACCFFPIQRPAGTVHTMEWRVQAYEDMTITEGDAVTFMWAGFHSLHQVSQNSGCSLTIAITSYM